MIGDYDHEAFERAYYAWTHAPSEHHDLARFEQELRRGYRAAWQSGMRDGRQDTLAFIGQAALREGADIVWESLRLTDGRLLAEGLLAARKLLQQYPDLAEARVVELLRAIVEGRGSNDHLRSLALDVMDAGKMLRADSWLKNLAAHDPDEDVRYRANSVLVRTGYQPAKEALFDDVRRNPDHYGVAINIWAYRDALGLSSDEIEELEAMLHRYVAGVADMARAPAHAGAPVSVVGALAKDGLAIDADTVAAIGSYARIAANAQDRRRAVEALAAIGTAAARRLLEELASASEPAEAAEHARLMLGRNGET